MRVKFRREYDGPAGSFSPGDVVNLEKDIAIDICNAGLAFPVKEKQVENQMINYPKHIGGPYWELSNGERFQGKKGEAIKAENE